MAISTRGRQTTERHRLAQLRLSRTLIRQAIALWRGSFVPDRARDSFLNLIPAYVGLVRQHRQASAQLAAQYYQDFRRAELIALRDEDDTDRITIIDRSEIDPDHVARSLSFSGPTSYIRARRAGHSHVKAELIAMNNAAADIMRLALNGGRETILETALADPKAERWARVTDGDPCAFCAMLASRGAVYLSRETASFDAHSGCGCTVEPVFSVENWSMPATSTELEKLWKRATRGYSGKDALNAFRRALEAERRATSHE